MATYQELRGLFGDSDLTEKIEVAVAIASNTIAAGDDDSAPFDQTAGAHDNRVRWAAAAITNTRNEALRIQKLVIADNAALTTVQILGASDSAIQSNVNASVDVIAAALFTGA